MVLQHSLVILRSASLKSGLQRGDWGRFVSSFTELADESKRVVPHHPQQQYSVASSAQHSSFNHFNLNNSLQRNFSEHGILNRHTSPSYLSSAFLRFQHSGVGKGTGDPTTAAKTAEDGEEKPKLKEEGTKTETRTDANEKESTGTSSSSETREGVSEDEDIKEREKRRETLARNTKRGGLVMGLSMVAGAVGFVLMYGAPLKDEEGKVVEDEYSQCFLPKQYFLRSIREARNMQTFIKEPSREKLLPEPLKEPYYQPKYTLVMEMTGVLVHPEWTYATGWRFKKRPAIEYFLQQIGYPNFEVVIYTQETGLTAHPILESLDPQHAIMYRLYKDTTKYTEGHHVKDLSKLNRDLSKVIFIDWDRHSFSLQPENALRVPKWEGDEGDTSLVDLAELLKTINTSAVDDVRPVVQHYSGFDNPAKEFRKRKFLAVTQNSVTQSATQEKALTKGFSGRLFGFRRH